jgi:hypothetical protein
LIVKWLFVLPVLWMHTTAKQFIRTHDSVYA